MEFRRINGLPPYVFATINDLKLEARRAGRRRHRPRVRQPRPPVARTSRWRSWPRRRATRRTTATPRRGASRSSARPSPTSTCASFGVELDPDTEVVTTIGAKEGLSHLMWVLVGPGDTALVPVAVLPDPHLRAAVRRGRRPPGAPGRAGAGGRSSAPPSPGRGLLRLLMEAWESTWPKPRVDRALLPAQPDDRVRRPGVHGAPGRASPASTTSCSSTTSPTPTSPSTATRRRRSSRCRGRRRWPSSSTR